ncbi:putative protein N(5)-glutamine methyltransferase [Hamadaea tsunoensis]|uniref:putative protein N(5)-glutamine methyltransferase n=1 Tax=Hamadaea tsunoensis TaxID=53368 RepID=UPI000406BED1|nr:putative protein N(5)-glutamine methyltransferase [Hamadaea tsunoensis]
MSLSDADPTATVATLRAAGCVFAEDEADLLHAAARTPGELREMVRRRVAGDPLEQILGWAEFHGLRIFVAPGVFVPRRRTEFLVARAATSLRPGAVVVDLCCGTGAVGAALLTLGDIDLYAADIDPASVACARRNLDVPVYQGDLLDALPEDLRGRIDVLVANAPYVPTDAVALMPPEARLHEPMVALDGGADGLDYLRRLAETAPRWLAPGGVLHVETSVEQSGVALGILRGAGFTATVDHDDDLDGTVLTAH